MTRVVLGALVMLAVTAVVAAGSVKIEAPLWGADGHEITALVAQGLLSSSILSQVSKILDGQTLEQVSTWADSVKSEPAYKWSAILHYIDTPDWACKYVASTDCVRNQCVAGAISNYTTRLMDSSISASQRNEALKFLTHFVGDIHQPLHVAFASDEGGNTIDVTYIGSSTNLHSVWDTSILVQRMKSDFGNSNQKYADYLLEQIQGPWSSQASAWAQCSSVECAAAWANDTAGFACNYAYVAADGKTHLKSGASLATSYYDRNWPIVDQQLAKGGVRLATVLEKALASFVSLPRNDGGVDFDSFEDEP